jgi:peptide-methionine (S)-S-oxide reductase
MNATPATPPPAPATQTAVLAGGCFWCLDAAYRMVEGVTAVTSGYAGGHWPNPTYERVTTGTTGHAESVRIEFDPKAISYADILDIFWALHNPTTLNRQGNDVGTQYRSVIFYAGADQKRTAEASLAAAAKLWSDPIVTQLVPLDEFYAAEDYHQDYYAKNPEAGYCQVVINPKLAKLREKFAARLKPRA